MKVNILLMLLLFAGRFADAPPFQMKRPDAIVMEVIPDKVLRFFEVDVDGSVELVGSLPTEFKLVNYQISFDNDQDWLIGQPDEFVLSPDQQFVAFSAMRPQERRLFVYQTTGEEVWSTPVEWPLADIGWSPDSTGFAFSSDTTAKSAMSYFDIESLTVTELAPLSEHQLVNRMQWIDDTLLYRIRSVDDSLMALTFGDEPASLFGLEWFRSDTPYTFGSICEREWSSQTQRLYVEVGCTGSPESIVLEELYAVGLNGDATLVLSAPQKFHADDIHMAAFHIVGIEVHQADVYVATSEYLEQMRPDDTHIAETNAPYTWRISRLTGDNLTEIHSSTLDGDSIVSNPHISPDGRYLVLGVQQYAPDIDGRLLIVDLQTGAVVREIDQLGGHSWTIKWLNNYTFLYASSYSSETCQCPYPMMGSRLFIVDLSQYPIADLSDKFTGWLWLFDERN